MYLPAPTEGDFELPPAGTHTAICYRVIDLGTQESSYNGQAKHQHKVLISWELPDEKMSDGRPFTISSRYTWSMSEKASLRRDLESWRGKPFEDNDFGKGGFDIRNIIGCGCILAIVHNSKGDKTYANITAIARLRKGEHVPALTNPKAYLWMQVERWNAKVFGELSQGLQDTIAKSPEYQQLLHDLEAGQQFSPPAHELRPIRATAPAQNGQRQHVIEQRGNYALSSTNRLQPAPDGLQEALGEGSTDIGATF